MSTETTGGESTLQRELDPPVYPPAPPPPPPVAPPREEPDPPKPGGGNDFKIIGPSIGIGPSHSVPDRGGQPAGGSASNGSSAAEQMKAIVDCMARGRRWLASRGITPGTIDTGVGDTAGSNSGTPYERHMDLVASTCATSNGNVEFM